MEKGMKRYKVTTESGSVYHVGGDGKAFMFYVPARQVNPSVVDNKPITQAYEANSVLPWPPEPGRAMIVITKHYHEPDHPDRMPGGGKVTSTVVKVEELVP
jgi:hypothetical protein